MRAARWILLAALAAAAAAADAAAVPEPAFPSPRTGAPARDLRSGRLRELLESSRPDTTLTVWIFLSDRGPSSKAARRPCLSPRAASRRLSRGSDPVGDRDLPVYGPYIDSLRTRVTRVRHASRYFNAVSAEIEAREVASVGACPFVRRIDLVAASVSPPGPGLPSVGLDAPPSHRASPRATPYGASFDQLDQVGAIELLDKGYNGSGSVSGGEPVLIGILDTGFRRDHEAFSDLAVEAEWDFIQGDGVTSNQPGDTIDQDVHGTEVLGVIAGRAAGSLVGPAWGARYLLAKTEITSREIRIEEDHWVAGIEWADSAGADIVTSSLGYIRWYTRDQLDGRTALCTRAAGIAVSHGIVVVNSAGNQGAAGLVAPADGDSVLAIGAVDLDGAVASFSSRGPTADGRIKPDFAALGVGVSSVAYGDPSGYGAYNGTSFAAPIVAGITALLLELHPDWSPVEMRAALRATSSASGEPDNARGWGIPNAALAAAYPESFALPGPFPNPFSTETRLQVSLRSPSFLTVRVYDCAGTLVKTLVSGRSSQRSVTLTWDGTNERGGRVASGVYFIRTSGGSAAGTVKVVLLR
jgi:serine protease AprX